MQFQNSYWHQMQPVPLIEYPRQPQSMYRCPALLYHCHSGYLRAALHHFRLL